MKNKKAAPIVIEYLKTLTQVRKSMGKPQGFHYNGIENLILREGEVFTPSKSLPHPLKKMQLGLCFMNAHRAEGLLTGWKYTEGYALSRGLIPMHHAWLSKDGVAVDPTWHGENTEHIGIVFEPEVCSLILLAKRTYGLLDDWQNRFPMLQQKFDQTKIIETYRKILEKQK